MAKVELSGNPVNQSLEGQVASHASEPDNAELHNALLFFGRLQVESFKRLDVRLREGRELVDAVEELLDGDLRPDG